MRTVLPYVQFMHVSWMWRVNGIAWSVPWADWLYEMFFDVSSRVISTDPAVPKPAGSYLHRLFFDKTYSLKLPFPGAPKAVPGNDWENPEVVGRCKRAGHVPLYSFPDVQSAVGFWKAGGGWEAGATLVHLSAQPETFLSLYRPSAAFGTYPTPTHRLYPSKRAYS